MAFVKKVWKDRQVQYPNRRTINDGRTTKVVTVGRDEGTITEAGDAFNAANMNDLENRILWRWFLRRLRRFIQSSADQRRNADRQQNHDRPRYFI